MSSSRRASRCTTSLRLSMPTTRSAPSTTGTLLTEVLVIRSTASARSRLPSTVSGWRFITSATTVDGCGGSSPPVGRRWVRPSCGSAPRTRSASLTTPTMRPPARTTGIEVIECSSSRRSAALVAVSGRTVIVPVLIASRTNMAGSSRGAPTADASCTSSMRVPAVPRQRRPRQNDGGSKVPTGRAFGPCPCVGHGRTLRGMKTSVTPGSVIVGVDGSRRQRCGCRLGGGLRGHAPTAPDDRARRRCTPWSPTS